MLDTGQLEVQSPKVRSRVSNGTTALIFGDGRSAGARRFRDLANEFGAELGGFTTLPATAQQLVRRLAQVSVELELLEAQRASGAAIDPVGFVCLVNAQRRQLRDLEALKRKLPTTREPTLREHLKARYGNDAAVEGAA